MGKSASLPPYVLKAERIKLRKCADLVDAYNFGSIVLETIRGPVKTGMSPNVGYRLGWGSHVGSFLLSAAALWCESQQKKRQSSIDAGLEKFR